MLKALTILFIFTCSILHAVENANLIPKNCNTLMGFDMAKIVSIPELKNFINDKKNSELQELRSLGLAPENIKSLIIGMDTEKAAKDPIGFQANPEVIIFAKMNSAVDTKSIISKAREDNVEITQENFAGYTVSKMKKDDKNMSMTKLADDTLVIGGAKMIKSAITLKTQKSKQSVQSNSELLTLIDSKKMIWIAGMIPEMPAPGPNDPLSNPAANAATQIKAFTLSGHYEKDLMINANLICKTVQAAAQISAMAQLMVGMASSSPEFPLKPRAIQLTTDKDKIVFNIKLDKESMSKIAEKASGNIPGL